MRDSRGGSGAGQPVVVGVDGSASSQDAINYAAQLAERRNAPLRLVCAFRWPQDTQDRIDPIELRNALEAKLRSEVQLLRKRHPRITDIHATVCLGTPVEILLEQSREACAIVVGSRHHGEVGDLLMGSVSAQVALHASCSVVVVRRLDADTVGPVLVAYAWSAPAAAALELAAAEAIRRRTALVLASFYERDRDASLVLLTAAAQPLQDKFPELQVQLRPIQGLGSAYRMVKAAHPAALTVVGSRGLRARPSDVLDSVSRLLIHHGSKPFALLHTET